MTTLHPDTLPSSTPSRETGSPHRRSRLNRWGLVFGLLALVAAGGWTALRWTNPQPDAVPGESAGGPSSEEASNPRRLALGVWQDHYRAKLRTMTLREDGTGTMVVDLEGAAAVLFAPQLRFDMQWSIDDGRIKMQTLGGEPAVKVQMILKMMGDHVDQPIIELSENRMLLLDQDGKTRYDWQRVP